ncbi:hypothetical protein ACFTS5_11040 [Nocardia sp. NPDC056952]|uniref:hypothetical protein n=1 Tax=Nocardia sp. NPDC056952 TaxID=3345979 RepID=UPI00362DDDBE
MDQLIDRIGLGVLTRVVGPGLVDEVLAETCRAEKRRLRLPVRGGGLFCAGVDGCRSFRSLRVVRQSLTGQAGFSLTWTC